MVLFNYLVPPNGSQTIYIPKTIDGSYDSYSINPAMINNRLSAEEINLILGRINTVSRSLVGEYIKFFITRVAIFIIATLVYALLLNLTNGSTVIVVLWVIIFVSGVCLVIYQAFTLSIGKRLEIQNIVTEENQLRLNSRGLNLTIGPFFRHLTLQLDYHYVQPAVQYPQVQAADNSNYLSQPFLVPPPRLS
eukprot:TRINITY_DN13645_c0_g1_i5.p1 TRINITY_DN13645_c0_g1~~TRINITY_DN13645_c0_g1_i5.p1  ORF type:complete len:192 (-),score=27.29 TRINITY_DN13645_c0_g1_i5:39-614(-)